MKKSILFLIWILVTEFAFSQNQLVSYYNSYSEVYGGMEDGGISRHESYWFKAMATITLSDIYFNNQNLVLKKGDTLVINVNKFTPYNKSRPAPYDDQKIKEEKQEQIPIPPVYKVHQVNRRYYANVAEIFDWDGVVNFKYKKKNYTVKAKEGFDTGYTGYAP